MTVLPVARFDPFVDLFIYELTDNSQVLRCDSDVLKTHAGLFIEPILESVTETDHGLNVVYIPYLQRANENSSIYFGISHR